MAELIDEKQQLNWYVIGMSTWESVRLIKERQRDYLEPSKLNCLRMLHSLLLLWAICRYLMIVIMQDLGLELMHSRWHARYDNPCFWINVYKCLYVSVPLPDPPVICIWRQKSLPLMFENVFLTIYSLSFGRLKFKTLS